MSVPAVQQSAVSLIQSINGQLSEWKSKGAHVLGSLTLQTVPPMHRPVVVVVHIDADPNKKEVYPQKGGGLSLSAIGWKKIGDALDVQLVESQCGRRDDGRDPERVEYRMVGRIKALDGTWHTIMGDKEIRMQNVIEELTDSKREIAQKYLNDPKDGPAFKRAYPDPEVWVQEKVRQEALQIRKHLLARAQTGAFARMIKMKGIRETYTAQELQKPFVFPKLVAEFDQNNPEDRAFLRAQAAGAIDQLFLPAQRATEPQPSMQPHHESKPQAFELYEVPQVADALPPPDPYASLRADFQAADPKGQAEVLTGLIKQKGYTGKIAGDMAKWEVTARQKFFDSLLALADVNTSGAALPFE